MNSEHLDHWGIWVLIAGLYIIIVATVLKYVRIWVNDFITLME